VSRGAAHNSVIDAGGNAASLSLFNGEGSAYIVSGTGVMLNNMLGEACMNVGGFHRWPEDARMSFIMGRSMIVGDMLAGHGIGWLQLHPYCAPTGHSKPRRLRHAAGTHRGKLACVHFEDGLLSIEDELGEAECAALAQAFLDAEVRGEQNMFFGGVHAVSFGAGDRAI